MAFKMNLAATLKSTVKKTEFLTVPPDGAARIRFLPPVNSKGEVDGSAPLFHLAVAHFGLEEDGRPTNVACLKEHGDGQSCPLCALTYHMKDYGSTADKKIASDIRPSDNWYAQVLMAEETADSTEDNPIFKHTGPYKLRFSKTAAEEIQSILKSQQMARQPFLCDPEAGQDLIWSRTGSGFDTKYKGHATGVVTPLSKVFPDWETKMYKDLAKETNSKMVSSEEMVAMVVATYPNVDWDQMGDLEGFGG